MTRMKARTAILGVAFTLSACGGGGGSGNDPADTGGAPQGPDLFFGAADSTASGNGLSFATADTTAVGVDSVSGDVVVSEDLQGQSLQVRIMRNKLDTNTGALTREVLNETAQFQTNSAGEQTLTLTLDGETLTFLAALDTDVVAPRGDGTNIGFRGEEVQGDFTFFGSVFADRTRIFGSRPGEAENGLFLVGFETDPDVVAARQGTVTYDATLVVSGVFNDDATLTNQNLGTALFTADFDDNMVSGDFSVNVGDGGMALALAPTAISGNGFAGDLQITACGSANCTSNSDVAGVFFGPNAEELNGIAQFDVSATDASGNTDSFVGSGVIINGD